MLDPRRRPAAKVWRVLALFVGSLASGACTVQSAASACVPGSVIPTTLVDGGPAFLECLANGSAYVLSEGPLTQDPVADAGDPSEPADAAARVSDTGTSSAENDASSGSSENLCDHGGGGCVHSCPSGHCH